MSKLPFGFDKPEDSPGFLLWQTTMTWQRQIKKVLEDYRISHAQFVIMATLLWFESHHYDTTQSLISQKTKLDKMTVSISLKKLVSRGYIVRKEHEIDTRAKTVLLTEEGKSILQTLVPLIEGIDSRFFGKLNPQQQKSLNCIFSNLIEVE